MMKRIVEMTPAYDKRNIDPSKSYGIHGVELRMVLKGNKGAVQFVLYTNWQLPHVTKEQDQKILNRRLDLIDLKVTYHPLPADLGYHSLKPHYEDQKPMADCPYLNGKPCYYDGSGLAAEHVYEILLKEGSEGVWKYLEDYYKCIFEA